MCAHVITGEPPAPGPAAATTAGLVDPAADAGWLALSAAMTEEVPVIADREDLLVTIAPGAGRGAPACFLPALATIEIDGAHLGRGLDPVSVDPARIADRARCATAWGLLTHECAHARHSLWAAAAAGAAAGAVAAARVLEESRIEAAQVRRRPDDRHWLRASATNLVLADSHADDPARAPGMSRWEAGHAAALLLGRTDAGILTPDETAAVARVVESVLGPAALGELRTLWRAAHGVADDDAEAMLELGRRWCEAIGADPDTPPAPDPTHPRRPDPASPVPGSGVAGGGRSALAEAITESVRRVAVAVASEPAPADPTANAAAAHAADDAAAATAEAAAGTVFTSTGRRTGRTAIAGTRAATSEERTAARRLGRALSTAAVRDRSRVTTTSVTPPGRLRMRGALAADAQRAAGALPTAEPFTRTTRKLTPSPPLRLGIACDVSGSMRAFAGPVASAAWILAHAAHHARMSATTATVIFGHHVRSITRPGAIPREVTEFVADDNYEDIPTAIDALDGALGLSRPGAARLLVIVSDGDFRSDPRREGQARITRLRRGGCGVLWLAPDHGHATPLDGATVLALTDPATTARTIGRTATAALRAAH